MALTAIAVVGLRADPSAAGGPSHRWRVRARVHPEVIPRLVQLCRSRLSLANGLSSFRPSGEVWCSSGSPSPGSGAGDRDVGRRHAGRRHTVFVGQAGRTFW